MLDSTTDSSRSPWGWYDQVDVTSTYPPGQLENGSVFVPRTPESFTHDVDGNLLSDGRWDYTWDGENRLIRMVARTAVGPQQRLEFAYDWQGRRIAKVVWNNTAGTGTPAVDQRFLYDQWNLIVVAVEVESQFQLAQAFVWGTDLSGSMQGAGGVGGLLKVSHVGQSTTNCFAAFDGNGNVVGLVDVSSGAVLARYEYGPFGELVRATGPMARANPFRFSTKYQDQETGFLYYGYRYYDPSRGSWLSRDPVQERGGKNLYRFGYNDTINKIDPSGQAVWWDCVLCAGAIGAKFQGTVAGCAVGCLEVNSSSYPFGQCLSECLSTSFSPCELWKSFKGNPAEWIGAAACVACGVHAIVEAMQGPPTGCDDCAPPKPKLKKQTIICYYWCELTGFQTVYSDTDQGCPAVYVEEDPAPGAPAETCWNVGQSN